MLPAMDVHRQAERQGRCQPRVHERGCRRKPDLSHLELRLSAAVVLGSCASLAQPTGEGLGDTPHSLQPLSLRLVGTDWSNPPPLAAAEVPREKLRFPTGQVIGCSPSSGVMGAKIFGSVYKAGGRRGLAEPRAVSSVAGMQVDCHAHSV